MNEITSVILDLWHAALLPMAILGFLFMVLGAAGLAVALLHEPRR